LRVIALVTTEVIWLRWLFEDFGVSVFMPTPLLSDSTGAISIDPVKHELTKHIGVDAHFHDHRFMMVLLLFSMCLQSCSWQIFSRKLRLAAIISFTSPNSVFLIHHEFEGGVRCILPFSIIVFFQGVLCIFLLHVHVYIWASGPQMNIGAIPNTTLVAPASGRRGIC
jgi:hypothetical protein